MRFSGGLRGGQGEPGESPGVTQVDPFEDRGHLGGSDLNAAVLGLGKAKGAFFQPLDSGITMPSFLWRYTNSLRSICHGPWVADLLCYRSGRLLGMTNSGCRAAIQEFFLFANRRSRRISSSSAQTIRCFPEGVRREWTQACLTQ